jgi:gliding motility-associated-like protein
MLPDTITLCRGDTASIEIKPAFSGTVIKWITPHGIINGTKKIRASQPGKYYIRLNSQEFPNGISDSAFVRIIERPQLHLRDTAICKGTAFVLDAANPGMKYLWSTGKTTQKIRPETPGRYWVRVSNGKCIVTDTVMVKVLPGSGVQVAGEYTFCLNDESKTIGIKADPGIRILWNTGAITPSIYISREGMYWVRTESEACGVQVDTVNVKLRPCDCEMFIPNSFTPNEDDRNDLFFPVMQCDYSYYSITITDRWGNTVFTSNNPAAKWDGRYKGNPCPEDNYDYRIESTEKGREKKQVRNGRIALFR